MKLLSITINGLDSTSFYRANGVFRDLQKKMPDLDITSVNLNEFNANWSTILMYDIVFMQRPYGKKAVFIAELALEIGIPVWIDYDDNLLELPVSNPSYDAFNDKGVYESIVKMCQLATAITVSTKALGEALQSLNKRIYVIPNALNELFLGERPKKQHKTVLWRGSNTHAADIASVYDELEELHAKFPKHKFSYFGWMPWMLTPTDNQSFVRTTDLVSYFKYLKAIAPMVLQNPLIDNIFNRCKSNIALLEGTWAGAACLVPEWDEWNIPGALVYKTKSEYKGILELILNGYVNIKQQNKEAWEYIQDNLMLSRVNALRVQLIKSLL